MGQKAQKTAVNMTTKTGGCNDQAHGQTLEAGTGKGWDSSSEHPESRPCHSLDPSPTKQIQ